MFYTMLVGRPPFDTEGAHPTLKKVIAGEYEIPSFISDNARNLIQVGKVGLLSQNKVCSYWQPHIFVFDSWATYIIYIIIYF